MSVLASNFKCWTALGKILIELQIVGQAKCFALNKSRRKHVESD